MVLSPSVSSWRRNYRGLGLFVSAEPGLRQQRVTQTEHHVVRGRASATPASRERAFQARSLGRQQREQQQQQRRPGGRRGPGGFLCGWLRPRGLRDGGEGGLWRGQRAQWGGGAGSLAGILVLRRGAVLYPSSIQTRPQTLRIRNDSLLRPCAYPYPRRLPWISGTSHLHYLSFRRLLPNLPALLLNRCY